MKMTSASLDERLLERYVNGVAWSRLPTPKPPWLIFKRMLSAHDNDPEKTRLAWVRLANEKVVG